MTTTTRMGYEHRILNIAQAIHAADALPRGSVVLITVEHDTDCLLLRGGRRCDCSPDTVRVEGPRPFGKAE